MRVAERSAWSFKHAGQGNRRHYTDAQLSIRLLQMLAVCEEVSWMESISLSVISIDEKVLIMLELHDLNKFAFNLA